MSPSAAVTGATGFLGRHLTEQLVAAGWDVTCLHRATSDVTALSALGVRLAQADLTDGASVAQAMPDGVDTVFHVAGNTSTWARHAERQRRDNVGGTEAVVAAAISSEARRLVLTSTWNTVGLPGRETVDEDTPQTGLLSKDSYTRTKSEAEALALAEGRSGLEVVVMQPAHILGRYDAGNWARMVTLVDRGRLPGVPPGAGSFCWAPEVAAAHVAAATDGRPGERYLLGGTDAPFTEVVATIARMLGGVRVPSRPTPAVAVKAMARVQALRAAVTGQEPALTPAGARMITSHPRITSTRAQHELGYRTVSLEVMLADTITWMSAEGLLRHTPALP